MNEQEIEQELQDKGLDAPRLTPSLIDGKIVKKYYHIVPDTTLTICVLTLENGYQVVGKSASVSKDNFNKEIGEKIAFEDAREQIWNLEGYLLKDIEYKKAKYGIKE